MISLRQAVVLGWAIIELPVLAIAFMTFFFVTVGGPGLFWHYGLLDEPAWWQDAVVRLPAFLGLMAVVLRLIWRSMDERGML